MKTDNAAARKLLVETAERLHKFVSRVLGPSLTGIFNAVEDLPCPPPH